MLSPFAHHDCEWITREKMGLPFGWERVCLLGSVQEEKRRFTLERIIGVLLSPETIFSKAEGRGDWPTVLTYHAYGPTSKDRIHVVFGSHQIFPVGKIMHACRDLCSNACPPSGF